ncbi:MAG: GFA family protein [Alphaproteobacteria bacterium]|nr:GFA family protein [Alphaproteobacteria bacterium]
MPMRLEGSCRCGAVCFKLDSHTPYPYQLCYCSICRKTASGGGYAINIMGLASSLVVPSRGELRIWHATIGGRLSTGARHFCGRCGSALWLYDPTWPDLVHPFASAIDTELPQPPARVHLMLRYKPSWVEPQIGPGDDCFDEYPALSIEDWHKGRGLWVD